MTKRTKRSLPAELIEHLWEHRLTATVNVAKPVDGWGPIFGLTTPAGVVGTVAHRWQSDPVAWIRFDGEPLDVNGQDDVIARQLLSSIQILRILHALGDGDDLLHDYRISRFAMVFGNGGTKDTPMRAEALRRLDQTVAAEVLRTRDISQVRGMSLEARQHHVNLTSTDLGRIILPRSYSATKKAVEHVLDTKVSHAISAVPRPILPPPVASGNGRLTRVLQLCHDALALDPDLAALNGSPIRPLLEVHVPELFARHQAAVITADPGSIDAIDSELEIGVEVVTRSIREALSRHADERRMALSEQIAFLQSRHPRDTFLEDRTAQHEMMEKTEC